MKKLLTSTLLSATVLGAGLAVSSNVNAADQAPKPASTNTSVQFVKGTGPIGPVNPTDPGDGGGGETGNGGALSIVYATKDLSFGADNEIGTGVLTLHGDKNVVLQVGDIRGNNAGWALSVKSDQLSDGDKTNPQVLGGAKISFSSGTGSSDVANGGTSVAATKNRLDDTTVGGVVLNAVGVIKDGDHKGENQGSGINVDTIKKDEITLSVPSTSVTAGVAYKSTLNWTLSDVPA
ncbi:WxL domain-containing protein [Dellaglioa algida]|uniref:Cell surface protein n=1 Tax=Dellaglioa algida TaxID=105612 RepID=A0A5C6M826_9LACO|nr:WxL domain-containing protein [Dellaglioa algida]MDK1717503.1 WxL domain-containing protein [Dellaglioa algida]MDK1720756.1 WxL domain-containing protein [Dellaglioa algida]MDK1722425.1 WxL domain-containing protein [Dellaglioa algida]MDK1724069.1 WxL domain-containing protein [Dellaglioa algida]MDK1725630.1 WxL domain-containing protein [Dellaglioa algida]